jgi:hypothetical protein
VHVTTNIGYFRVNLITQQEANSSSHPQRHHNGGLLQSSERENPRESNVELCLLYSYVYFPIGLPPGLTLILWIRVELREETYL